MTDCGCHDPAVFGHASWCKSGLGPPYWVGMTRVYGPDIRTPDVVREVDSAGNKRRETPLDAVAGIIRQAREYRRWRKGFPPE